MSTVRNITAADQAHHIAGMAWAERDFAAAERRAAEIASHIEAINRGACDKLIASGRPTYLVNGDEPAAVRAAAAARRALIGS